MNPKIAMTLIGCGTACVLAPIAIAAYLLKQLSPQMLIARTPVSDFHVMLILIAAIPATAVFAVGLSLIWISLRRSTTPTS